MDNVIHLENVSWIREKKELLKNIDWRVKKGENWALLGLNGSGKTSLLNIITGYRWPTTGSVQVLGRRFGETNIQELRKSIGWVSSSLQEKLHGADVAQEVVISGKHASIGLYEDITREDIDRALFLLEFMGVSHLMNRSYETCSQGEKQKLLIARALMADPEILILDEPCNGLDLFSREKLLESIHELAQTPNAPTLLFVTHHIEEILPVFGYTLLLRRGEVFSAGKTEEVLKEENLSAFFEHPVSVLKHGERITVQLGKQNVHQ
ncbi:ABC transporter ATP-binding protein [Fictibacillus sp. Mic-4]|uniref:ABC transporter ATP-binding protein n=1 Tax=Fictibacillus sp. Mic-4 TaxID=3132826 RepID=UPI003CF93DAA